MRGDRLDAELDIGLPVKSGGVPGWVADALDRRFLDEVPVRRIGDKAYDSDVLDAQLDLELGVERIAPNRRKRRRTEDARPLHRYRR